MKSYRTFLALPLAEEFHEPIKNAMELAKRCYSGVKWVQSSTVHVTLHFFGPTNEEELKVIHERVAAQASLTPPLDIGLSGLGFFPSSAKPRVVWLGIYGDTQLFANLQSLLEADFERAGFSVEYRSFQAHATLGRIKEQLQKTSSTETGLESFRTPLKRFNRLVLYHSLVTPQGSRYEVLQSFPLAGKAEN